MSDVVVPGKKKKILLFVLLPQQLELHSYPVGSSFAQDDSITSSLITETGSGPKTLPRMVVGEAYQYWTVDQLWTSYILS